MSVFQTVNYESDSVKAAMLNLANSVFQIPICNTNRREFGSILEAI